MPELLRDTVIVALNGLRWSSTVLVMMGVWVRRLLGAVLDMVDAAHGVEGLGELVAAL